MSQMTCHPTGDMLHDKHDAMNTGDTMNDDEVISVKIVNLHDVFSALFIKNLSYAIRKSFYITGPGSDLLSNKRVCLATRGE